ncbi:Arylsulfatase [Pontiella desulfatans]|uniref:Arylsulfatase n=1 Tax=Pontiella desulfatans TaxID=2750659 RepID=A0A6C2U312_PONDE|nr:sulfatase-like hydrolase/transferase [Pontiella desulfatans]SPS73886.1 sulfatase S1_8 [Kiritimatiellales bacterium]VGO13951.1 Arylsulfatase [Pontiella desulfatans]
MKKQIWIFGVVSVVSAILLAGTAQARPNFLIIVADDLNHDSPGFSGVGVAPDVTPNLDRLASQSYYIENGFSTVAVCQPSRQSMLTGRYPGKYGGKGFFPIGNEVETVTARLKKHGYITATLHKVHHMLPVENFAWDYTAQQFGIEEKDFIVGRSPDLFYKSVSQIAELSRERESPFIFVANSADPHRPFSGNAKEEKKFMPTGYQEIPPPSRTYSPEEINVQAVLPDLPGVRQELAYYANSVRRLDDTVGACMKALRDSDVEGQTVVVFVADNGMALPFGKFDCYLDSNKTPILFRLPDGLGAGKKNSNALVSLIDITPTLLELAQLPPMEGIDGNSLVPVFQAAEEGKMSSFRDYVVTFRHEDIFYANYIKMFSEGNPGFLDGLKAKGWRLRHDHPSPGTYSLDRNMRMIFDGRYSYIYNHWRMHGKKRVTHPSNMTFDAMLKGAKSDPILAERLDSFMYRAPEELYDYTKDRGARKNLMGSPEYRGVSERLKKELLDWMQRNDDPQINDFSSDAGLIR